MSSFDLWFHARARSRSARTKSERIEPDRLRASAWFAERIARSTLTRCQRKVLQASLGSGGVTFSMTADPTITPVGSFPRINSSAELQHPCGRMLGSSR